MRALFLLAVHKHPNDVFGVYVKMVLGLSPLTAHLRSRSVVEVLNEGAFQFPFFFSVFCSLFGGWMEAGCAFTISLKLNNSMIRTSRKQGRVSWPFIYFCGMQSK
jgi:hypothetical protein